MTQPATQSATGVTVDSVRGMLAGIPSLTFIRSTGLLVIEDDLILENILAAEAAVGTELEILLGVFEVRCQHGPAPLEPEPGVIVKPAIDRPRNWFEGDRWGATQLPVLPVREILMVRAHPSGWARGSFEVPLERVRTSRKGFQIASSALAVGGTGGFAWGAQTLHAPLALMTASDGRSMPGGLEVTYLAGLSRAELDQYPLLKTLVRLQALILTLTFYQAFLGGGAQKEQAGVDGMTNSVELARRDVAGPLGGEIAALKSSYKQLLATARMKFGSAVAVVHL